MMNQLIKTTRLIRRVQVCRFISFKLPIVQMLRNVYQDQNVKKKGLFFIDELSDYSGFEKLKQKCFDDSMTYYNEILSSTQNSNSNEGRNRNLIEIFDDLSNCLCLVADLSEFIRNVHPDNQFKNAATATILDIGYFIERLNTDVQLYETLRTFLDNGDQFQINQYDRFIGQLFLHDFEISGVHLPKNQREQIVDLTNAIMKLNQKFVGFEHNFEENFSKLPVHLRESYSNEVSKSNQDLSLHDNKIVRKTHYILLNLYNQVLDDLLKDLLKKRYQLARLCGYNSFADRALCISAASTPSFVTDFLNSFVEKMEPFHQFDMDLLRRSATTESNQSNDNKIAVYDISYHAMKLRQQFLGIQDDELQQYFTLNNCLNAFNQLVAEIFQLSLMKCDLSSEDCWSNYVFKLQVHHQVEGYLGDIYCDLFQRSGKLNQDSHFTVRGFKEFYNRLPNQTPIVVIVLNLKRDNVKSNGAVLLTPQNVESLFHEMGHALASMFGRTKYQHVSGTRCSTDLAEVPSILMEYFAFHPKVLKCYAKHFETLEPIPNHLIDKLLVSRSLLFAHELKSQSFYAMLDICFHGNYDGDNVQLLDIYRRYHQHFYGFEHVPDTAWYLHFNHLVTYGSKYYSYLFSRAIASLIWHSKFSDHQCWSLNGEQYRRLFLAHGGGKPARQLISDYLGLLITPDHISDALISDLKPRYKLLEQYFK